MARRSKKSLIARSGVLYNISAKGWFRPRRKKSKG